MTNQDGKYNVVLLQCTGIFKNNEQFAFLMLAFFQYFASAIGQSELISNYYQYDKQIMQTVQFHVSDDFLILLRPLSRVQASA